MEFGAGGVCSYFFGGATQGVFAVGDTIDLELINTGDEAAALTLYRVPDGANTESIDELERVSDYEVLAQSEAEFSIDSLDAGRYQLNCNTDEARYPLQIAG